mgnify:CR=1 FL=1
MSCLKSLMKLENPKTKFKSMEYCQQLSITNVNSRQE